MVISTHAIKQFYKRKLETRPDLEPEKRDDVLYFYNNFIKHLKKARLSERKNQVRQLLSHDFQEARYYVSWNWVFVVEKKQNTILTCFPHEHEKNLYRPVKNS